jgi:hypothetical protein
MVSRSRFGWMGLALLCAPAALGAQNLLGNPSFDQPEQLAPWVNGVVGASWSFGADFGSCTQSGSAQGTSVAVSTSQALRLYDPTCIVLDGSTTSSIWLAGRQRTEANVWSRFYLQLFSDSACTVFTFWSAEAFASGSPTWAFHLGEVAIPENTGSALFWLDFNPKVLGLSQFTAAVDELYLGSEPLLFADGFEADSGSPCRWSVVVDGAP